MFRTRKNEHFKYYTIVEIQTQQNAVAVELRYKRIRIQSIRR